MGALSRGTQAVRVQPSAVSELFWVLLLLVRPDCLPQHHPANAIGDEHPDLRERAASFWHDQTVDFTELFALAQRGGLLFETDVGRVVDGLDAAASAPDGPIGLESEAPEDVAAVRARLARLRDDADLRRRYAELLRDVWATARPMWEAQGRQAVEQGLREWPERIERASSLLAAVPHRHVLHKFVPAYESALARGEVVLTPVFFAGTGHLIELPGALLIGAGTIERDRLTARRAEAEALVGRLKVLVDPTRVMIVALLSCRSLSVGELVQELRLSQPTISVHVRQLREAGLLDARRDGGRTVYSTTPERVDALLDDARTALRGICED